MYSKIMIATDGSELSERAIEQGLDLAKALKASVTVVCVTEPVPAMAMADEAAITSFQDLEQAAVASARAALDGAAALTKGRGVRVEFVNPTAASAAAGIVEAANKAGAELIVMASHGRSGLRRLMLGSQAADVLVNASVPVLVVRLPEKRSAGSPIVPMPLSKNE
jgi:nucleotide-binding universal stress UspA family protein